MIMPIVLVLGVCFILSLITQIVNKLLINEKRSDENNKRMKEIQDKLKGMDPKSTEFAKFQEEVLDISMKNMRQQFKPLIITFIPFIIVLQMMAGMYAFAPIEVGSKVNVMISGSGLVDIPCLEINQTVTKSFSNSTIFSGDCNATISGVNSTISVLGKTKIETFEAGGMKVNVAPPKLVFIKLPFTLPFIGNSIGWLGTFVIASFLFSSILNRALKGRYLRKWD